MTAMTLAQYRQRLLGRVYRAIDPRPLAEVAIRIEAPTTAWRCDALTLTLTTGTNAPVSFDLTAHTIASLAAAITGAGYTVSSTAFGTIGARAMVEGGAAGATTTIALRIHTSILWSITGAWGRWLSTAQTDVGEMLRQMNIQTAEGENLEFWARWFRISRRDAESDASLRFRTAYELRRPRSNARAIEANIQAIRATTVTVREPWQEMFILSASKLDVDHLSNDEEFSYHRLQLIVPPGADLPAITAEAEADRPAGSLFLPPSTVVPTQLLAINPPTVLFGGITEVWGDIRDYSNQILSWNYVLSDITLQRSPDCIIFAFDIYSLLTGLPAQGDWSPFAFVISSVNATSAAAEAAGPTNCLFLTHPTVIDTGWAGTWGDGRTWISSSYPTPTISVGVVTIP